MSLAIVGGTVVDVIFSRVPRLPVWPRHTEFTATNLVLLRGGPIVTLGGNGANAAYVAAATGADVTLHTQIGDDALGGWVRAWCERAGCRVQSGPASATAINVTAANAHLHRATFFYPGENLVLPKLPPAKAGATRDHLLVCGWPHPPLAAIAQYFYQAQRRNIFTALDAGPILTRPWTMAGLRPVLASLDLFLSNDYELRRITRAPNLMAALVRLRRDFTGHVVIKRGAEGAMWLPAGVAAKQAQVLPGKKVKAINTIGAGDSFNGALLAALSRGQDFPRALRVATRTAASVVSSPQGILGVRSRPKRASGK